LVWNVRETVDPDQRVSRQVLFKTSLLPVVITDQGVFARGIETVDHIAG